MCMYIYIYIYIFIYFTDAGVALGGDGERS